MTARQNTTGKYLPACRLRFAADGRARQRLPALLHDIGLRATEVRRTESRVNHCVSVVTVRALSSLFTHSDYRLH